MINGDASAATHGRDEPELARLAELMTRRIQLGLVIDVEDLVKQYPTLAEAIRGIFATLDVLHDLRPRRPFGRWDGDA